jgi:hypothetical protein
MCSYGGCDIARKFIEKSLRPSEQPTFACFFEMIPGIQFFPVQSAGQRKNTDKAGMWPNSVCHSNPKEEERTCKENH